MLYCCNTHHIRKRVPRALVGLVRYLRRWVFYVCCDGWIERKVGKAIKRYTKDGDICIDLGCGNFFKLGKYFRKGTTYCGIDKKIDLQSPFLKSSYNIFQASGIYLPFNCCSVDILICMEVLYEVNDWKAMISEIYRVCKNKAIVVVSTSNMKSYKYQQKGLHQKTVNSWEYEEFLTIIQRMGFSLLEGCMLGWWIPIFRKRPLSFMIPLESHQESMNTNYFYTFRVEKH